MKKSEQPQGPFLEIFLEIPRHLADAVCNVIIENICSGLVLEEEEGSPDTGIIFYVPRDDDKNYRAVLNSFLNNLPQDQITQMPEIRAREIKNTQWEEQYRKSIQPVAIYKDIKIIPPWMEPLETKGYNIIIEPKMAFGTGRHETTQSCLKAIRDCFQAGMTFLDLGCGSGVLSLLASQMGASYIKGIDYDITAVDNSRENFKINNVTVPYDIVFGTVEEGGDDLVYDFVCVNIIKSTILPVLSRLKNMTKPGGWLVLSGLLASEESEVTEKLSRQGLTALEILRLNEWLTYIIRRT